MSVQTQLRSEAAARSPLLERVATEHAAAERTEASATPEERALRQRALERLLHTGLPTSRDENWRYANLRLLERVRFGPPAVRPDVQPSALPAPIPGYARYVFIDGRLAAALSATAAASAVALSTGAAAVAAGGATDESDTLNPGPGFTLVNAAFAVEAAQLRVRAADAASCVELVFVASGALERGTSYPRLRVDLESTARLRLVERHVSLDAAASCISAIDVTLDDRASLDHYRVQQLGQGSLWIDTLTARVAAEAQYSLHILQLGALAGRSTCGLRLAGPRAQLRLHALAVGQRRQVLDTYALVEHAATDTRTEESFRGIAAEHARLAFNGKIIVHPGAHRADSSQSLRGLLAGADAEIDVRPQLEIYTDDVRCSHGATAGKLDENMLFYLLSRGLERERAMRLLKWAFLEDVVARIEVAELRRAVERSLAGQLSDADALQELL